MLSDLWCFCIFSSPTTLLDLSHVSLCLLGLDVLTVLRPTNTLQSTIMFNILICSRTTPRRCLKCVCGCLHLYFGSCLLRNLLFTVIGNNLPSSGSFSSTKIEIYFCGRVPNFQKQPSFKQISKRHCQYLKLYLLHFAFML